MQESLEEEVIEVVEGGYADHRKDDFDLQDEMIEKQIDAHVFRSQVIL